MKIWMKVNFHTRNAFQNAVRKMMAIFITMMSRWAPWRLKSPASGLFAQSFVSLKKTSKLRITGICEGNPPVTGGFPSQRASNAENVSIWWRHHGVGWVNRVPQTVERAHDSHHFVIWCFVPPVVFWQHHRHGGLKFWRVARHIRWSSK